MTTLPSTHVAPPRIADSPVAFECRTLSSVVTGPHQTVVIGRVLAVHIDDRYLLDAARAHIDTPALDLVARSYGSDYVRSHDTFQLAPPDLGRARPRTALNRLTFPKVVDFRKFC